MNVYGVLHRVIDSIPHRSEQDLRDLHDTITGAENGFDSLEDYRRDQEQQSRSQTADQQMQAAQSGQQIVLTPEQAQEWLAQQNVKTNSPSLSDQQVASTRPNAQASAQQAASQAQQAGAPADVARQATSGSQVDRQRLRDAGLSDAEIDRVQQARSGDSSGGTASSSSVQSLAVAPQENPAAVEDQGLGAAQVPSQATPSTSNATSDTEAAGAQSVAAGANPGAGSSSSSNPF